ncbi:MAG: 23S rRNA (adenine(2503)-C(2))-methyltransferase RlmN [Alphaproteobacteria bacterium]|nr:23S rRNA (adenine(2503)-C(2))-methyltransferase RlmN [Alphaproteobacteria bacterium]
MAASLDIARANPNAPPVSRTPVDVDKRLTVIGLTRTELADQFKATGVPEREVRMRASQIWRWVYNKGAKTFDEMTNVSKDLREQLAEQFTLARPEIVTEQISVDGTRKWLLRLAPDAWGARHEVETVYIPEENRGTLCVSSQVGCTLTCSFCHTGTQTLVRNLTAEEIVQQLIVARDQLGEWPAALAENPDAPAGGRFITNMVLMGMGEPLYNFDNVKAAMEIVCDNEGLSLSRRRITLSTSGVVPMIERCGEEIGVMLAISLHATRDEIRNQLVPLNKKYPIKQLLDACRAYPGLSNARRITFEYVMLKGVNDSPKHAKELVQLLRGIPAKVNLIPYNPWPGSPHECSEWDAIEAFAEIINRAGYSSPVRTPRGRDIMAACGQLKSASERLRAKAREQLERAPA